MADITKQVLTDNINEIGQVFNAQLHRDSINIEIHPKTDGKRTWQYDRAWVGSYIWIRDKDEKDVGTLWLYIDFRDNQTLLMAELELQRKTDVKTRGYELNEPTIVDGNFIYLKQQIGEIKNLKHDLQTVLTNFIRQFKVPSAT
ncbi:hypothetical protein [Methylococcus mesophilus]|uniref:hypothetical protein n=1 Tax=Methylococcus mesophilus TaxID=2993564 RepID=UPI00224AF280|nr:hypothetical protein [Methylococcus mesophilus]UZR29201.1 hypothetical protein OOT43_00825 [Methylococcus mesophilus]